MRLDGERFLTEPLLTTQPLHVCYHSARGVFACRLLLIYWSVAQEIDNVDTEHIR